MKESSGIHDGNLAIVATALPSTLSSLTPFLPLLYPTVLPDPVSNTANLPESLQMTETRDPSTSIPTTRLPKQHLMTQRNVKICFSI